MNRRLFIASLAVSLFLIPQIAYANVGTPLMYTTLMHLLFCNAIIGFGEGLFLAHFLKVRKIVMIPMMIVANYFSAWVGWIGLNYFTFEYLKPNFNNAMFILWLAIILSFLLTLHLEFPFVYFAQRKQKNHMPKLLRLFALSQICSYAILFLFYFSSSSLTILTKTKTDHTLSFLPQTNAILYYISTDDGDVYSISLDSLGAPEKVCDLNSDYKRDDLFVFPSDSSSSDSLEGNHEPWDLLARIYQEGEAYPKPVLILPEFSTKADIDDRRDWDYQKVKEAGIQFAIDGYRSFGPMADLREAEDQKWYGRTESMGWGFSLSGPSPKGQIRLALDAPFINLPLTNATVIPGDILIFQFGQQICALECETRKIGVIAEGRGPIVVLK